jgi:hypothetical protein
MSPIEFTSWLDHHCNLFDGVRAFCRAQTMEAWRKVLASVSLATAIEASNRLYESEHRPRSLSDHAAAIKRIANDLDRQHRNEAKHHSGPTPGDRERDLRERFKEEWEGIDPDLRRQWIEHAISEHDLNPNVPPGVAFNPQAYIEQIAWTMFAEACDPAAAEQIAMTPVSDCRYRCSSNGMVEIVGRDQRHIDYHIKLRGGVKKGENRQEIIDDILRRFPIAVRCCCPKGEAMPPNMRRLDPARDTLWHIDGFEEIESNGVAVFGSSVGAA